MRLVRVLVQVVLSAAVIGAGVFGFRALGVRAEGQPEKRPERTAPSVETIELRDHEGTLDLEASGLVVPYRRVTLHAEVAGRIRERADVCRAGRWVEEGTALFEIDDADYRFEARRLEEQVEEAETSIRELDVEKMNVVELERIAEAELAIASGELQRLVNLSSRDAVSQSEVDRAKRSELAARNALRVQKNQLAMNATRRERLSIARDRVQVELDRARHDLERLRVAAPVAGVVVDAPVEEGGWAARGAPLVTLEDTSKAEVRFNLRMDEIEILWSGQEGPAGHVLPPVPVTIVYGEGERTSTWAGTLSRYDGSGVDEKTRTVPCRATVDEPRRSGATGPPALLTGMYVRVRIHAPAPFPLLVLPEAALRPGQVVWRTREGRLEILRVRVVRFDGQRVLLDPGTDRDPLARGDRVVVSPLAAARDGMEIRAR